MTDEITSPSSHYPHKRAFQVKLFVEKVVQRTTHPPAFLSDGEKSLTVAIFFKKIFNSALLELLPNTNWF